MFVCYSNPKMKKFWLLGGFSAVFVSYFPCVVFSQNLSTTTIADASLRKGNHESKTSPSSWFSDLGKDFSKVESWWNQKPVSSFTQDRYSGVKECSKKGSGYVWDSRVNACVKAPAHASVQCLGENEFWNGQNCVNSQAILKSKTASSKERQAALKAQKKAVLLSRENCQRQWGFPHENSCIALSKEIEKKTKSPLYVYIPCAVFFSQQHDQPNFACKPGDTLKLAKSIGSPPGINRNVRYIFYGPAGYQPNLATKDYLCQKKTAEKLLAKNCLPLGKKITLSAGVDSENVHGQKKLHLTIYPSAGSIGYSNGSAATIQIGNQYLGIPTGKNVFDVVVAKAPSWTPPPAKKKTGSGSVAKKPGKPNTSTPTPGEKTPSQTPSCADLKTQLAGAEAQIHSCLETLQKSPAMQTLIKTCEKAQGKGEADCAVNLPAASAATLVLKNKSEGKPDLAPKLSCSQQLGKWQARVVNLRKQMAQTPSCQAPSKDKNPPSCPPGQALSSASGGGICVPNGSPNGNANNSQGNDINNAPSSNCTQSASAPAAKPKDQQNQTGPSSAQESASKPNPGETTASIDCGGTQKNDKSSWPKLPWKGMGLIGVYGGLLGALLLGPIGMFVFGLIGVGVGYLISK
jgi:hypothetical protein